MPLSCQRRLLSSQPEPCRETVKTKGMQCIVRLRRTGCFLDFNLGRLGVTLLEAKENSLLIR
jgi:hypothetical protein